MQASTATETSAKALAEDLLAFWHQLMRGSSAHLYAVFAELDLTMPHVKALHSLADCGCKVSVKELSERLGLSLPATSRTVDALLKRGWMDRREDEVDRRMKRVGITDAGREVVRRVDEARLAGLEEYTATLTAEQRARLSAALADLPHRS